MPVTMAGRWRLLDSGVATRSGDARRQIHHAAQLAASIGISYLPKQSDDSHTNLEWIDAIDALASRAVPGTTFRLAVRPHPFGLLALGAHNAVAHTLPLDGMTLERAAAWVGEQVAAQGIDPALYTLARHYTIPPHPIDNGAPFAVSDDDAFREIGRWFADAADLLGTFTVQTSGASDVRCWPHHFDIATLVTIAPGRFVGVGMEPGDGYYDEPYYYVNLSPPPPAAATLEPLSGGGHWHTREWTGAVLDASHLGQEQQREQIATFIDSAFSACTGLLALV
jgi:hypothetical protein